MKINAVLRFCYSLVLASSMLACTSADRKVAIETLCRAPQASGCDDATFACMAPWIEREVKHTEVRELAREAVIQGDLTVFRERMLALTNEEGIAGCPLLEALNHQDSPDAAPERE